MKLEEFLARPIPSSAQHDDLDLWNSRSFKQQMQDVYGEAARLIKFHRESSGKLESQWQVFDSFCIKTYLDPKTTDGERETLKLAEWELYDFVFGDNVFRNTDESVMRWFSQWVFDVNYAALSEG